jgi:hypothetical protein
MDAPKAKALETIIGLAREHRISAAEITAALGARTTEEHQGSSNLVSMLAYMGGVLIFSGLAYYISDFWLGFGSYMRILVTFGAGLVVFLMGLAALMTPRYHRAAAPLLFLAAVLEPFGIAITMHEFYEGDNVHLACFIISGAMTVQLGAAFYHWREEILLWGFGLYFTASVANLLDWVNLFADHTEAIILGASMLLMAYGFKEKREYYTTLGAAYFFGSGFLLWGIFDVLEHSWSEPLFVLVSGGMMYISAHVKSRAMLSLGALSLFSYITYYSHEHFAQSIGWAAMQVILGILFLILSGTVVKLGRQFKQ